MGHLFQIVGSFPDIYISQGSVSTCLRCDGIFNDQFITQSLLRPRVKKNEYKLLCPRGTQTCALALANIAHAVREMLDVAKRPIPIPARLTEMEK